MKKIKMLTFIVLITSSTASLASKTAELINVQATAATSSAAGTATSGAAGTATSGAAGTATTGAAAGSVAGSILAAGTLSSMAMSFGMGALATLLVYTDESNKGSDSSTSTSVTTKG